MCSSLVERKREREGRKREREREREREGRKREREGRKRERERRERERERKRARESGPNACTLARPLNYMSPQQATHTTIIAASAMERPRCARPHAIETWKIKPSSQEMHRRRFIATICCTH
jgi:hypothetical protein